MAKGPSNWAVGKVVVSVAYLNSWDCRSSLLKGTFDVPKQTCWPRQKQTKKKRKENNTRVWHAWPILRMKSFKFKFLTARYQTHSP